jgi:hypothetical protein
MNLSRKNVNYDINLVREVVEQLLDGPDSCVGYRSILAYSQIKGYNRPSSCCSAADARN